MTFSARAERGGTLLRVAGFDATLLVAAAALTGCGLSDGPAALLVDPGRYSAYHCKELIAESQTLANREKELRNLLDKASEGGGGSVIGALTYRSDYEAVM